MRKFQFPKSTPYNELMKQILPFLIPFFFTARAFSQDNYLARLSISGNVSELGISPAEELWVATMGGNVYYTRRIGELWHLGPYGSLNMYNYSSGKTFERLNFFSEDTMMISGFIQEDSGEDVVYWSGDHGQNWEKVKFGKDSWIDAAFINNNGKAWMSGSSQLIYYTEDYGKTWTSFEKIEKTGNLRFSTIHFASDERTGMFGSFWNVLYKTMDNCKTWEKLPTPLDQKKYTRISDNDRPDIRKIRIFGDYYILNQQGRVFVTPSDSVNWVLLPGIDDFEVTESGNLYCVNNDRSISLYDGNMQLIWKSEQNPTDVIRAIGVKNNKLFLLTSDAVYKISPKEFVKSALFTDDIPIPEPYLKLQYEGETYGFDDCDILRFDSIKGLWVRHMTVEFNVSNVFLFDNKMIISDNSLNNLYVLQPEQMTVSDFVLPPNLFAGMNVAEIHFEKGSQGCFHSNRSVKSYAKKQTVYSVDKQKSSDDFLKGATNEIETGAVSLLIKTIDSSRFKDVLLSDLKLTEQDITEFKKFIDKKEESIRRKGIDRLDYQDPYIFPGENTDFHFYKSIADSLFKLSQEELNNVFWKSYGNWSTTRDWLSVAFVFDDGKQLIVTNFDDRPNFLCTPWIVSFEGIKFRMNSIAFGQQIDELTNGQFFADFIRDKNYAIFMIADYLYRKKNA